MYKNSDKSHFVVDFHQDWTDKGYIQYKDWNMNVVQDPMHYRIDILPDTIKQKTIEKYNENLSGKVVTKLSQIKNYCTAEEYHQKYLEKR